MAVLFIKINILQQFDKLPIEIQSNINENVQHRQLTVRRNRDGIGRARMRKRWIH